MKKALLISLGSLDRLKLVKEVIQDKYDVTMLLSDFSHTNKKKRVCLDRECTYIHVPAYRKNLSLKRCFSLIYYGYKVSKYIKKLQPELIYAILPPNNMAYRCMKYKKAHKNMYYVVDIYDLWPESMPLNKFKNNIIFKLWAVLRDSSLKIADLVFTECGLYCSELRKNCKLKEFSATTLYLVKPQNKEERHLVEMSDRNIKKDKKEIVLGYLGSINYIIDMENICKLICCMKAMDYSVRVKVIGDGEKREQFINGIEQAGAEVEYYGKIFEEKEKIRIFSTCNLGLNMMRNTVKVGLTTKSIDYFSMGLPIINSIKGDTWEIVEMHNAGFNYDDNLDDFVGYIRTYQGNVEKEAVLACYDRYFTPESFKKIVRKEFQAKDII